MGYDWEGELLLMMHLIESRAFGGASIGSLYEEYQRPILAYLTRLVSDRETAEDLCQETFLRAMRGWSRHDPASNTAGWLYRIATNAAYDYLRRRRRIRFISLIDTDQPLSAEYSMESRLEEGEPVRRALAQLPAMYRLPLVLHSYEGRDMQEIAETLGCSTSAIKTRLFRARERFRKVYQG